MTKPSPRLQRMLKIKQVAERSDVSTKTVRRWIQRGEPHAHRLVKLLRVSEEDFMSFMAARRE